MTSFQTYSAANHFRHPWYDDAIMKRKQPTPININEDMDDEDESEVRPTKRRRCTGLENSIAHLSLHPEAQEHSPSIRTSEVDVSPGQTVVLPDSVEEPSPEVKMGSSSWYEPERDRIVITDLDSYAEEELDDGPTVTELDPLPGVSIPHILLERGGTVLPCDQSRALVLFRPLSFTRTEEKDDGMDLDDM